MNSTPTFGARLAVIEREVRAANKTLHDLEIRMRKQEGWRQWMLGAIACGSIALNLLRGCG